MGYTLLSAHSHVFGSVDGVKAGRILVIHTAGANTRDPVVRHRIDGLETKAAGKLHRSHVRHRIDGLEKSFCHAC